MKKPNPKNYGLDTALWKQGGKKAYENARLKWVEYREKYGIVAGRPRSAERPIHESWADYVAHFDPTNPTRSQGAFCRWAGLSPAYVSAAKNKRITKAIEEKLSEWIEELQKLETDEQ